MSTSTPALAPTYFSDLGIPPVLSEVLEKKGIKTAFPIQAATLPDSLAGRDVCGKAPTGSGKTLAFGLGILSRLANGARANKRGRRHPVALILVPTRELAAQIEEAMLPLAKAIGARIVSIYGGVGYGKQLGALKSGVDVMVACPGRLTDLVERGSVRLEHVDMVVIDEADQMADMGFLPAVRKLVDRTNESRQILLFSATLDGPVEKLVRDYQHDPVRHDVVSTDADRGKVSHHFWRVDSNDRFDVASQVIQSSGPAVVFCRTKHGADRLSDRLARTGLASAAIHGNRSQSQRERALASFRAGRLDVLVATDIAARGIHVDAVPLVVHFDPPADPTDYVHRSGRTGRSGADGTVVSLIGSEHLRATKRLQQSLGLQSGVSSPDLSSIANSEEVRRVTPAPRAEVANSPRERQRPRRDSGFPAKSRKRPIRNRRKPAAVR